MSEIKIKRVYEAESKEDGFRILVDRLWPRGVRKEDLKHDLWLKEVAPSDALRKWFHHEEANWSEFKKRYLAELQKSEAFRQLVDHAKQHKKVTLLYGAKDEKQNQAVVLKQQVEKHL